MHSAAPTRARQAASRRSNTSDFTILGSPGSPIAELLDRAKPGADCNGSRAGDMRQVGLARTSGAGCHHESPLRPKIRCHQTEIVFASLLRRPPCSSMSSASPWQRSSHPGSSCCSWKNKASFPLRFATPPWEACSSRLIIQKELTGSAGELTVVHGPAGFAAGSVLIVGLGPSGKFDAGTAYAAGFALAKRLAGKPRESVALAFPMPSIALWQVGSRLWSRDRRRHARARTCARPRPTAIRSEP